MSTPAPPSLTNRDPKAGCLIMIIGAVIFGGLIAYTLFLPFQQAARMKTFTQGEPVLLSTAAKTPLSPSLRQKLNDTLTALDQEDLSEVSLALDRVELNTVISFFPEFQELQGTLAVHEIQAEEMLFEISFPLRGRPFSEETPYLNGTMRAQPSLQDGELVLHASALTSRQGEVPEGFRKHFDPYRIMAPYQTHPLLGRLMSSLSSVSLQDGKLQLTIDAEVYRDPSSLPVPASESKRDSSLQNGMLVASFFLVGGLFFWMVKRRNAASARALREG